MLKILVVAYDSGGAYILASLIKKYHCNFDWVTCVSGPAKNIFLREEVNLYAKSVSLRHQDIDTTLKLLQPDLVLTGTGWETDSNLNFIKAAKRNNIKTVSFLDHWCNYRERFGCPGKWMSNLPDFIFVGDKMAYKLALNNGFPREILIQVENPYFLEVINKRRLLIKKGIKKHKKNKLKLLYLSQPMFRHNLKWYNNPYYCGYTEYQVVEDLLKANGFKRGGFSFELKIRLHPSEKANKYLTLLMKKEYGPKKKFVTISNPQKNDLIKDCLWADVVVGHESMALVIALMVGKRAISYLPPKMPIASLFYKGIKKVFSVPALFLELKKSSYIPKINNDLMLKKNDNLFSAAIKKIFKLN